MTNQEAFDNAVTALFKQGQCSVAHGSVGQIRCMYRGFNDSKCVVGGILPDELYDPEMDTEDTSTDIAVIIERYPEVKDYFEGISVDMLADMQAVHDSGTINPFNVHSLNAQYQGYRNIALSHGLSFDALNKAYETALAKLKGE